MPAFSVFINDRSDLTHLPVGHPYLVNNDTMEIQAETFAFLNEHYVKSTVRDSPGTWLTAANDLVPWLECLEANDIDWRTANLDDVRNYRDLLKTAISPHTGKPYAGATIRGRMATVIEFYGFGAREGWYKGTLYNEAKALTEVSTAIDRDSLAHSRRGVSRALRPVPDLYPSARSTKVRMRPFTFEEWALFSTSLGPLPSERTAGDTRSSRDRLIGEFGAATGARLQAIKEQDIDQYLSMRIDAAPPGGHQLLRIRNKGGAIISITVPNWLVAEILIYIRDERRELLAAANLGRRREPRDLFLGALKSRQCGRPITRRRYQQIIDEHCLAAGLTEISLKTDRDGNQIRILDAKHSIHDLRHTYVCWHYFAAVQTQQFEPWKEIQTQLGHESVQTTIDVYGSCVGQFQKLTRPVDVREYLGI